MNDKKTIFIAICALTFLSCASFKEDSSYIEAPIRVVKDLYDNGIVENKALTVFNNNEEIEPHKELIYLIDTGIKHMPTPISIFWILGPESIPVYSNLTGNIPIERRKDILSNITENNLGFDLFDINEFNNHETSRGHKCNVMELSFTGEPNNSEGYIIFHVYYHSNLECDLIEM